MGLLIECVSILLNLLYAISAPILWLKSQAVKTPKFPPLDPLLNISATDLASKIRKREITSEQICIVYIKRIQAVNPILNAIVEERFESALQEARNVDIYLQSFSETNENLEKTKPLLGVPLTVKESCSLAGLSLCGGTLGRLGVKSKIDGDAVSKLKKSGAIPLLVSNTPEISLSWECQNLVTGRTNNPYDITRTSGASSGGEGALLGAGASLIGVGSDVAGSIRLPAMFNGVFGHKPTSRAVSITGHYPSCPDENYWKYFIIGPLCRYAKDLKLMMSVMCQENIKKELKLEEKVDLGKLRVFYMVDQGNFLIFPKVQPEISSAIEEAALYLKKECNSTIDDFKFEGIKDSCEFSAGTLYRLKNIPNLLKGENQFLVLELFKSVFGQSHYTFNLLLFYSFQVACQSLLSEKQCVKQNRLLRNLFIEKLGNDGVFLYPTFPTSAFKHGQLIFNMIGVSYLMLFNTLGLPSTNIPCGFDKNGLPIGIQVVAAPNQDRLCLAVAEELENCFGGWIPPLH